MLPANGFGNYYAELNFYAQKRRANDGRFTVMVDDFSQVINSHVTGGFSLFTYNFIGTGASTSLKFVAGQGGKDTVGHFLDNISISAPPESGAAGNWIIGFRF